MAFRFLHAADLHLDTPFSSVGTAPESVLEVLREASLRAWRNLVEHAITDHVAFVVLAGDIYDGAERGLRAQHRFAEGLTRLHDEGIRSFIAYGNHDPVTEGWSALDHLPASVTVFPPAAKPAQQAQAVSFAVHDEPVTVTGISYATRETTENLVGRFPVPSAPGLQVGVVHANVGAITGHAPYSPCTVADLAATGYDYWALGHIHRKTIVREHDPWIVYPGDLQGRSPKVSECEPKGAMVVTATGSHVTRVEPVTLDVVRFVDLTLDIADHDLSSLLQALEAQADPGSHDGRSVVVRATIAGSGHLHDELATNRHRDELLETLRDRAPGEPFVWWDRITWSTRPALDQLRATQGNDFLTDLLTLARGDGAVGGLGPPRVPLDLERLLHLGREPTEDPEPPDADLRQEATRIAVQAVREASP